MEISEWADVRREWLATFLELGPEGQTHGESTLAFLVGLHPGHFVTRSSLGRRRGKGAGQYTNTATKLRRSIRPPPRPACRCAHGLYGP